MTKKTEIYFTISTFCFFETPFMGLNSFVSEVSFLIFLILDLFLTYSHNMDNEHQNEAYMSHKCYNVFVLKDSD